MKINTVASYLPQRGLNCSKPAFKGVFGERTLFNSFENEDYTAKEYYMDYYPFADESKDEIRRTIDKKRESLDKTVARNPHPDSIIDIERTHINVNRPLLLSRSDLYQIQDGQMPKMLEKIERFIRLHADAFKKC